MFKIAWKYIKGYKKNTVICITGIAFSVMLIFSLVGISNRIMNQYQNLLLANSSLYDVKIDNIDEKTMDEIYHDILPDDCDKLINQWCGTIYTGKENRNTLIIAVEGKWTTFYNAELKEGRLPNEKYEICVEERFCEEYGINVADKLSYDVYDDEGKMYKVTFEVVGVINNMSSASMSEYIFTSYETSLDLADNQGFVVNDGNNSVLVLYDTYAYSEEKIVNLYEQLNSKYGLKFVGGHVEENEEKIALFDEKGTYTLASSSFYGVCAVVFACMTIFIYNAISINMTEKIRQYGMLRCIGMDNKKLILLMLMEQLFNSVIGVIFGIAGGKLLNGIIANKVIGYFVSTVDTKVTESILSYIITVAVALISVLLALIGMLIKISKRKPLEMLRHMEKSKEVKLKRSSSNVILGMAQRNIKRNPSKSRILMSTIFIASLLIFAIGNVITSIDFNINKTSSGIAQVEVFSSFSSEEAPYIDMELIERIKQENLVKEVYCQRIEYGYDILIQGQVSDKIAGILIYSDNLMEKFLEFNKINNLNLKDEIAIIIEEEEFGDITEIKLYTDKDIYGLPNAKKECSIAINDCIPMSGSTLMGSQIGNKSCVIINEKLATQILGEIDNYTNIYVKLTGTADVSTVKEMTGIDEYTYIDLNDSTVNAQNQIIGMMIMALYMMITVIVLNIFVISNMIKSNISLRAKEIGMLRSIGAEKKWVEKTISSEIIILALKGLVPGILVSVPICLYVYSLINENVGIGYGGYIVGIPVIISGVYVISKAIIKRCLKLEITEMIRSE